MPFLSEDSGGIPRIAIDGSDCYGYAREHHTVELWFNLWKQHSKMVLRLGTPPSCTNLTTYIVALWNQAMSGADTVRGLHESNKQKLGGSAGPTLILFHDLVSILVTEILNRTCSSWGQRSYSFQFSFCHRYRLWWNIYEENVA